LARTSRLPRLPSSATPRAKPPSATGCRDETALGLSAPLDAPNRANHARDDGRAAAGACRRRLVPARTARSIARSSSAFRAVVPVRSRLSAVAEDPPLRRPACVTTRADRLNARLDLRRSARAKRGLVHAPSQSKSSWPMFRPLRDRPRYSTGHPATLAWLGAVPGHRVRSLASTFRSDARSPAYRHYGASTANASSLGGGGADGRRAGRPPPQALPWSTARDRSDTRSVDETLRIRSNGANAS